MRLLAALLLIMSACDSVDRDCTLVGCDSFVQIQLGTFPASQFQDQSPYADIEVCLNDACTRVLVDAFPSADEYVETRAGNFVPGPQAVVGLRQKAAGDIEMFVTMRAYEGTVFHDGDVYRVTFRRFDESVVAFGTWSVAYKTTYPNGSDCEPTCRQSMTLTPI